MNLKQHIIEHEILGITAGTGGGGSITVIDGFPTYTDTTRGGKTLSINRNIFTAGKAKKTTDMFLEVNSTIASSKNSYRMLHNGTITGISLSTSTVTSCILEIYKAGSGSPLTTLTLSAGHGTHSYATNADFVESDVLQFYIDGTCYNPIAWIEVAWRF
jgi:hypothetical protein